MKQDIAGAVSSILLSCDSTQVKHMNNMILEVDSQDNPIGPLSKLESHIVSKKSKQAPLHRAFSVFMFKRRPNDHYELLLQKRSLKKITFPDCWTNTCCSHPSYDSMCSIQNSPDYEVRKEAVKRLEYELNINNVQVEDLFFMGRVHYSAKSNGPHDVFGEHEIIPNGPGAVGLI
ncbi:hypothetical protein ACOME3_004358 [Neoechinorhynchus agilis]